MAENDARDDSGYAAAQRTLPEEALAEQPSTPEERAAERSMREAEVAVVQHIATDDQRRRVEAMAEVRTRADRRRVWMQIDRPGSRTGGVA